MGEHPRKLSVLILQCLQLTDRDWVVLGCQLCIMVQCLSFLSSPHFCTLVTLSVNPQTPPPAEGIVWHSGKGDPSVLHLNSTPKSHVLSTTWSENKVQWFWCHTGQRHVWASISGRGKVMGLSGKNPIPTLKSCIMAIMGLQEKILFYFIILISLSGLTIPDLFTIIMALLSTIPSNLHFYKQQIVEKPSMYNITSFLWLLSAPGKGNHHFSDPLSLLQLIPSGIVSNRLSYHHALSYSPFGL